MTQGQCPHPWNKHKAGTFKKGHSQVNDGKGCFQKGHKQTDSENNKRLGQQRYAAGVHPFIQRNMIAQEMANKSEWYGIGKALWKRLSKQILERDEFTCKCCGADLRVRKPNCYHIIPYSISKDNSSSNLISLCIPCHASIEYFTQLQYQGGTTNG